MFFCLMDYDPGPSIKIFFSQVGWFANPIFGDEGNYPDVMLSQVAENSDAEGLVRSRLPYPDNETIEYVKGELPLRDSLLFTL